MKQKKLLFIILLVACQFATAQNIQFHYDLRNSLNKNIPTTRNYLTTTIEMFKPDKWGSTFFFIDMDYNQAKGNIGTAYWEIARDFKIGKCPIMPHIEYNGGAGNSQGFGFSIANAYLLGASYPFSCGNANFSTYLAYKYNAFAKTSNDVQWTGTWGIPLFDNKMTLSGFIDVWTENKDRTGDGNESGKRVILLTEPQVWYNVNSKLSLGSEIEISNNFYKLNYSTDNYAANKLYVFPTIAAKWNF